VSADATPPPVRTLEGEPRGAGLRVAVVVSRFNEAITAELCRGAVAEATERGVAPDHIDVVWVPGAFELPVAAARCAEAARGIQQVGLDFDLPVAFGVVTTNTMQQAWARAGRAPVYKGGRPRTSHKGREAMETVLRMATLLPQLGDRRVAAGGSA